MYGDEDEKLVYEKMSGKRKWPALGDGTPKKKFREISNSSKIYIVVHTAIRTAIKTSFARACASIFQGSLWKIFFMAGDLDNIFPPNNFPKQFHQLEGGGGHGK